MCIRDRYKRAQTGIGYLAQEASVFRQMSVEDNDFEDVEEEAAARGGGACAVDPALYSMLKDLRKKV